MFMCNPERERLCSLEIRESEIRLWWISLSKTNRLDKQEQDIEAKETNPTHLFSSS